jgi:hypothetical protein
MPADPELITIFDIPSALIESHEPHIASAYRNVHLGLIARQLLPHCLISQLVPALIAPRRQFASGSLPLEWGLETSHHPTSSCSSRMIFLLSY